MNVLNLKLKKKNGKKNQKVFYVHTYTKMDLQLLPKKNKRTGEVKKSKTTYVLFQRSSSKSRKGECLFIDKDLLEPMQNGQEWD